MIGAIISMRYIGKKTWMKSIMFWLVYLVVMVILSVAVPFLMVLGILIGAIVFIALAHYWKEYALSFWNALKVYAVALVIDLVIMAVVFSALLAYMPWYEWAGLI